MSQDPTSTPEPKQPLDNGPKRPLKVYWQSKIDDIQAERLLFLQDYGVHKDCEICGKPVWGLQTARGWIWFDENQHPHSNACRIAAKAAKKKNPKGPRGVLKPEDREYRRRKWALLQVDRAFYVRPEDWR